MASAPRLSKNRPILRTNTTKNADEGGGGWSKIPKILRTSYKVEASLHSGEDNRERERYIRTGCRSIYKVIHQFSKTAERQGQNSKPEKNRGFGDGR